jgi:SAM-dependent methyltransferase
VQRVWLVVAMDEPQNQKALTKNQLFFADNDRYKQSQTSLETYRFIGMSAAEALKGTRRLLDVGNGGVFAFPIDDIPEVVAVDVFVEESFRRRYPTVKWIQASALDMTFEREFDAVVEINALHHIVGSTVSQTYRNLETVFRNAWRALDAGGRLVVIESTVPGWFLPPYKAIFPLLLKLWPLRHPPTFQFHYRDLLRVARANAFELQEFCWIPKTSDILTLGFRVRPWMTPVRIAKMIFVKPGR